MAFNERTQDVDVGILKEIAKKDLVDALNSVNGAKTLVLDSTLSGPLGLVTDVALLKHHSVDKMFWLEPGPLKSTTTSIVYLCRPLIKYIKIIADQIRRHTKEAKTHTYTLLLVPRSSTLVTRILEEEGVLGHVTVSSYKLQFIQLSEDVVSLEHENAFKELWADGDESIIYDSAQALATIQRLYGTFPRIVGKGDYAKRLATLLMRQTSRTAASDKLSSTSTSLDSLIILDRRVDMITPLLTQLTYEGLIDEHLGIKHSHVELPVSLLAPSPAASANPAGASPAIVSVKKETKKKYHLTTTTDPLLAELRDLNFSSVGRKLNQVARRLDDNYKTDLQNKSVAQLKDFVGKLGGLQTEHQAARLHTGLSELIVSFTRTEHFNKSLEIQQNLLASYDVSAQSTAIEEMIAQGADLQTVVRLLCLASITAGGVKTKSLENLKREILQTYGYEYLPLLLSLASSSLGMMLPNPLPSSMAGSVAKYPFAALRKSLRLLLDDNPEGLDEVENDIGFVYSGYAPISIRLVQCIAQKGGVLSNPAGKEKEKEKDSGETAVDSSATLEQSNLAAAKVQAHPIVGWKGFEDVIALIPGETFDIVNPDPGKATNGTVTAGSADHMATTVIFFLGGCTFTEIAALRWVGRQNQGRKFLIATTGITSGGSIINSLAGISASKGTVNVGV